MCIRDRIPTKAYMAANMFVDKAATDAAIAQAQNAVAPVEYKKGQAIAREGEILTEKQIALMDDLGLMSGSINLLPYLSILIILIICMGSLDVYKRQMMGRSSSMREMTTLSDWFSTMRR